MSLDEVYRPFALPEMAEFEVEYREGVIDLSRSYGKSGTRVEIYRTEGDYDPDGYANVDVVGGMIMVDEIVSLCREAKGGGRGTFIGCQAILGVARALLEQNLTWDQVEVQVIIPEDEGVLFWQRLQGILGLVGGRGSLRREWVEQRSR